MDVALIPPMPDLHRYATTNTHLLLSHLFSYPGYVQYYATRRERGDYLILDNSAHEAGVGNLPSTLLEQATRVHAQEIVCPDVLFDDEGTVDTTLRMFRYLTTEQGWEAYVASGLPRLMLVPQGTTRREWVTCLHGLVDAWEERLAHLVGAPPVIGVSKDYEDLVEGGIAGLIRQHLTPLHESMAIDVHCLGWPSYLWSLARVKSSSPWVRSTDSAKPFVYAKNGIRLEPGGDIPKYPRRDRLYFEDPLGESLRQIAAVNVEVFKAAAADELILA